MQQIVKPLMHMAAAILLSIFKELAGQAVILKA